MNDYQKALEDFRNHYRKIYEVNLDDEVLYFFIRVNELQRFLKHEMSALQEVVLKESSGTRQLFQKELTSMQKVFKEAVSSMRQPLAEEMKIIAENSFPKGKDTFLAGLKKFLYPMITGFLTVLFLTWIFITIGKKTPPVTETIVLKNGEAVLKIEDSNHIYFLKLNQ